MKILCKSYSGGFEKIFTHEYPSSEIIFLPKSEPYVIFKWPLGLDYTDSFLKMYKFSVLRIENDGVYLVFTGNRNILKAVDEFMANPDYQTRGNHKVFDHLKQLKSQIESKQ